QPEHRRGLRGRYPQRRAVRTHHAFVRTSLGRTAARTSTQRQRLPRERQSTNGVPRGQTPRSRAGTRAWPSRRLRAAAACRPCAPRRRAARSPTRRQTARKERGQLMSYDWFSVFGIELEYMIVAQDTLDVRPIADRILNELSGKDATMEVERGDVAWSNELARHVLETKTNGPVANLADAKNHFLAAVADMNRVLSAHGARLLPGGMHPWMMPDEEFELWPTDEEGIYGTFDRIFDCRGHGWSN